MPIPLILHGTTTNHHFGDLMGTSTKFVSHQPGFHPDIHPTTINPNHGVYCGHVGVGYTTSGGHITASAGLDGCAIHNSDGWHTSNLSGTGSPTFGGTIGINF